MDGRIFDRSGPAQGSARGRIPQPHPTITARAQEGLAISGADDPSVLVAGDHLAPVLGAERPPDSEVDRVLDEPDAAVGEQDVDAPRVAAPRGGESRLKAGPGVARRVPRER